MKKASTKKKSTHGGARPGSGPKPKNGEDIKKPITVYVAIKDLNRLGGADAFREKCYGLLK